MGGTRRLQACCTIPLRIAVRSILVACRATRSFESEFGPTVLQIVEGCTDADTHPKPPYRERKERYIAHIRSTSPAVRLVSCADKLHNARAIVADLRALGNALFDRFNGGRDGTLWYYDTLATEFEQGGPQALAAELRRAVDTMKALASGSQHE